MTMITTIKSASYSVRLRHYEFSLNEAELRELRDAASEALGDDQGGGKTYEEGVKDGAAETGVWERAGYVNGDAHAAVVRERDEARAECEGLKATAAKARQIMGFDDDEDLAHAAEYMVEERDDARNDHDKCNRRLGKATVEAERCAKERDEARAELKKLQSAQVPFDREAWVQEHVFVKAEPHSVQNEYNRPVITTHALYMFGRCIARNYITVKDDVAKWEKAERGAVLATLPPTLGAAKVVPVTVDLDRPETWQPKEEQVLLRHPDGTVILGREGGDRYDPRYRHGCRWIRVADVFGNVKP